ncbi:MAG: methyltransferase domain-containing protein, partial [Chloroflexota bacterium]
GAGNYVGVGGNVKQSELIKTANVRELQEETGLIAIEDNLVLAGKINFLFPAKPDWNRIVYIYTLQKWQGEAQESEEISPAWFEINKIPYDKMWADSQHWLPKILAGEKINAQFTYSDDNETLTDFSIENMRNYLWLHLQTLPYFRSLLRAVEAHYYQDLPLAEPIYDLGCGDGHFASLTFDHKIDIGLDPWEDQIREAPRYGAYKSLVVADGGQTPFPSNHFASGLSNSVLEHVQEIDQVLLETARILQPGALFLFCVPNPDYYTALAVPSVLKKLGLTSLAKNYINWFARISRVFHANPPEEWQTRLASAGLELVKWWNYFPPASLRVLEWGHYFGLPSFLLQKLLGRSILAPYRWNLGLTARLIRPYVDVQPTDNGTFTFYVARKLK